MTTFSSWSLPAIDENTTALLHILLPFVIGFLVSYLFYRWLKTAGLQSAGFSPTLASILTAPVLAFVYSILGTIDFIDSTIRSELVRVLIVSGFELALFAPAIPILSVLLVVYLRGGFRGKRARILWAVIVSLLILEIFWIGLAGVYLSKS